MSKSASVIASHRTDLRAGPSRLLLRAIHRGKLQPPLRRLSAVAGVDAHPGTHLRAATYRPGLPSESPNSSRAGILSAARQQCNLRLSFHVRPISASSACSLASLAISIALAPAAASGAATWADR